MRSLRIVLIAVVSAVLLVGLVGCSNSKKSSTDLGLKDGKKTAAQAAEGSAGAKSNKAGVVPVADGVSTSTATGEGTVAGPGATADDGTPGSTPGSGSAAEPEIAVVNGAMVKILWWNDTSTKKPKDFEIVYGKSSYKPDTAMRKGTGNVGPVPQDKEVKLLVYPDGRGTSLLPKKPLEFTVLFATGMSPESDIDAIHVAVSDGKVQVLGTPVPNFTQVLTR